MTRKVFCLWCELEMESPNQEEYCCKECHDAGNGEDAIIQAILDEDLSPPALTEEEIIFDEFEQDLHEVIEEYINGGSE